MKSFILTICVVCAAFVVTAEVGEAERLVAAIQSPTATAVEKEDACFRLKRVGTANSVPALATLLADEHLYQAACDALETMPFPEAERALQAALGTTSGHAKAGVIHALGERRSASAVKALAGLLNDPDAHIADAAVRALGKIGGSESVAILQAQLKKAPLRSAGVNSLLQCANQMARSGDKNAQTIFEQFNNNLEPEHVRSAAFAGLIRMAGDKSLSLVLEAVGGEDPARQIAALQLAREIKDPKATEAFTNLLAKATPPLQAALITLLQQRDDTRAVPAVLGLASSKDDYVRVTAIAALGTLGDAALVHFLANAATSQNEEEQKAARVALIQLHRGEIGAALVKELAIANADTQSELARALAGRFEKSAVPPLMETARKNSGETRVVALRALGLLADGSHLGGLVKLLADVDTETARADVRHVFQAVADRLEGGRKFDVSPIVEAIRTARPEARIALLQVSALFADEQLRDAFRSALKDGDASVRTAAARAMCDSRDVGVMPDMLEMAGGTQDATLRALALEGYVRLAGDERAGFAPAKRLELLRPAYELGARASERKMVLSGLASVPQRGALELASRAVDDAEVKAEAEVACVQIAKGMLGSDPQPAEQMLQRLATGASTLTTRESAQSILKQFDSGWLCTGAFRQEGKRAQDLFNVAFAPEQSGGGEVAWRRAPGSGDAKRRGEVVLDSIVGGNDCVVYLKTRVFVPKAQPVALDIGSDDGIKLWINGELVHANNAVRGLTPGQDHAKGALREGWNDLRAKITQSTLGCGMIVRIKSANGSEISGLRFDPSAEIAAKH